MGRKITKKQLIEHLEQLEADDLRQEILRLYTKFTPVREFYQVELSGAVNPVLDDYKKKIHQAYFPTRGRGKRKNSIVRKLISDFRKISVFEFDLIDLLLFRVECAVQCARETIQKRDTFYKPVVSSLADALVMMQASGQGAHFAERCQRLGEEATNEFYPLRNEIIFLLGEYQSIFKK